MALSAANILLQITGDGSDGEKTLADISRDLSLFAKEEAEAAAYVDTEEAEVELDELKAKLAKFDGKDVSAEINVKIAKAQADLAKLQAELDKVDHEDVNVDVDVKRGNVERIAALAKQIEGLGKDLEGADESAGIFSKGLDLLGGGVGSAGLIVKGFAGMIAVALVAALAAAAASLAEAVAGAGALAVAFGATIPPGIALAVGAIARFKEQSGTAGTAAYDLKERAKSLFDTFKEATAGGADAVFEGIASALKDLDPVVKSLGPAFTRLGEAGGKAFELLGKQFSSPFWKHFFTFVTDSLAKLTPLFARSFGAFARILANIAQASMPYLISGLRKVANWLESIGDATSNIKDLRGGIGDLVDQLKAWLGLAKSVGNAFLGFIEAAGPQGKSFVEWLSKGAEAFTEWEKSKSGREQIHSFFHDVLPIAKEAIKAFFGIAKVVLQITQFFAPLITAVLHGFNDLIGVVSDFIGWLTKIDRAAPDLGEIWDAIKKGASAAFDAVKSAVSDAFDWVKEKAEKGVDFVSNLLGKGITFVVEFADDIASRARDLWQKVKGTITDRIEFITNFASDVASRARDLWQRVKGAITDRIEFLLSLPSDIAGRARDLWGTVKGIVTDVIGFIFSLPSEIAGRARDLWNTVKGIINDGISFVLNLPNAIVGAARELWNQVKEAVSGGIDLVIHLIPDVSSIPGKLLGDLGLHLANGVTDLFQSSFALVGERGPELAFLPQGTDIYDAGATRNILKALGRGQAAPVGAGVGAAPGGATTIVEHKENVSIVSPGTGAPDPDLALALWSQKLRARGVR